LSNKAFGSAGVSWSRYERTPRLFVASSSTAGEVTIQFRKQDVRTRTSRTGGNAQIKGSTRKVNGKSWTVSTNGWMRLFAFGKEGRRNNNIFASLGTLTRSKDFWSEGLTLRQSKSSVKNGVAFVLVENGEALIAPDEVNDCQHLQSHLNVMWGC